MNELVVTLDTDWAPDAAIDYAAGVLIEHGVRATWFITHASAAIDRLRGRPDLFEIGIHPNFLFGGRNDHGRTPAEVLAFCMNLAPEATSMRTHALVQSTPLLDEVLARTPVRTDVSLLLPRAAGLNPVHLPRGGKTITRIPYVWEDDVEMDARQPIWNITGLLALGAGLKVMDFHPIHVFLNSADMRPYEALKAQRPIGQASAADMQAHVHSGPGARTMFVDVCAHLAAAGSSVTIGQLSQAWNNVRGS